jgi:hypothetical protein
MIRVRPSSGAIVMDLSDFKAAEYGGVCQRLGLRPSQPWRDAEGRNRRPRRRRRRKPAEATTT